MAFLLFGRLIVQVVCCNICILCFIQLVIYLKNLELFDKMGMKPPNGVFL